MMSRNAAMKAAVEAADAEYAAKIGTELPPSDFLYGPAFGGGRAVDAALKLAEKYEMLDPILAERDRVATALRVLQLAVCTATWSKGETDYKSVVLSAIKALQSCKAVDALGKLVTKLATVVYSSIPQGEGYDTYPCAKVKELNTNPTQEFGFEAGGALAGIWNDDAIPMADWTAEMEGEIKAAVAWLKADNFGDVHQMAKDGLRSDLFILMISIDKTKEISPVKYLLALGVNRFETFRAKGYELARSATRSLDAFSAGPLKTENRIASKCMPSCDYYSDNPADDPPCKKVMDELRGSLECKTHVEMERAHVDALRIFGAPAVVKDRRNKPQHDMLFVFKHEGMYVELQLHFVDTLAVKALAHPVFEIQRLNAVRAVQFSGLDTVINTKVVDSAKDVKLLLHI